MMEQFTLSLRPTDSFAANRSGREDYTKSIPVHATKIVATSVCALGRTQLVVFKMEHDLEKTSSVQLHVPFDLGS